MSVLAYQKNKYLMSASDSQRGHIVKMITIKAPVAAIIRPQTSSNVFMSHFLNKDKEDRVAQEASDHIITKAHKYSYRCKSALLDPA